MLKKNLIKELENVKTALEEHLNSINENTTEIQALFDYLQEMEVKIEKFSQRLDQIQLKQEGQLPKPGILPLDQTEKKVFLTLYTEEVPQSYREIADKANIPLALVPECLSSLAQKGVPIARSFCNECIFISISAPFKELQAKENLINLSLQSFM